MVSSRSSPQLGQAMIDCNMTSLTFCVSPALKDIARLHRQTSLSLSFVGHLYLEDSCTTIGDLGIVG